MEHLVPTFIRFSKLPFAAALREPPCAFRSSDELKTYNRIDVA
jgi:hypothetical protein